MSCDKPGVLIIDDDCLWLGCSSCGLQFCLGDTMLVAEVINAERLHHGKPDE